LLNFHQSAWWADVESSTTLGVGCVTRRRAAPEEMFTALFLADVAG
jgi:hypothetical protein